MLRRHSTVLTRTSVGGHNSRERQVIHEQSCRLASSCHLGVRRIRVSGKAVALWLLTVYCNLSVPLAVQELLAERAETQESDRKL